MENVAIKGRGGNDVQQKLERKNTKDFSIDLLCHSCELNYFNQVYHPSFYLFVHHFSFIYFCLLIHCVHLIISLSVLTTAICALINLYLTAAVTKFQPNGMKKICLEVDKLASKVVEIKEIIVSNDASL